MRTLVIGDIHGAHNALLQCLERSEFGYAEDRLIVLGDICDGYPQVKQCIDEMLKIKNLDYVIGNHDLWALDWARKGIREDIWLTQGGYNTMASYEFGEMPPEHIHFLANARPWIEENNRLFVHGGFNPEKPISKQDLQTLVWDRDLVYDAFQKYHVRPDFRYGNFEEIFLGHTPTTNFGFLDPLKLGNVWMLDTGAGWGGRLTIMDVETKEYWQSDLTSILSHRNFKVEIPIPPLAGPDSQATRCDPAKGGPPRPVGTPPVAGSLAGKGDSARAKRVPIWYPCITRRSR